MMQMKKPSTASLLILMFAFGMIVHASIGKLSAQTGGTINGCIRPLTSLLRIIGDNETCNNNETPLSWSQSGGGLFPIFCPSCVIRESAGDRLIGQNLTNSVLFQTDLAGANFSGSNLTSATIADSQAMNVNFTNVNLTNTEAEATNFSNSNFDGANFTNTNLNLSDFTDANLNNVTWSNTTCPDGTNSDDNGNTCEGHLVP